VNGGSTPTYNKYPASYLKPPGKRSTLLLENNADAYKYIIIYSMWDKYTYIYIYTRKSRTYTHVSACTSPFILSPAVRVSCGETTTAATTKKEAKPFPRCLVFCAETRTQYKMCVCLLRTHTHTHNYSHYTHAHTEHIMSVYSLHTVSITHDV